MTGLDSQLEVALASASRQGVDPSVNTEGTIRPDSTGPGVQRPGVVPLVLCVSEDDRQAASAELVLGELLGKGAMGTVHVARERALERDVAVKRLRRRGARYAAALRQEARLTGSLEHPNIIPVHSLLRTGDDDPMLVMKRVEGHTWRELIRAPASATATTWREDPLERHLGILVQVSHAVEFAHSKGVLHLDLKPDNVMVGDFGATWLMDWGVAIRKGAQDSLPAEEVAGTPAYMAPELLGGRGQADERTDVFLLGACLHEVLTGQPRHRGRALAEVFGAVLSAAPVDYDLDVPIELGRIANKACSKERGERYPNVEAFREAVEDFQRRRGARQLLSAAHAQRAALVLALEDPHEHPPEYIGRLEAASRFAYGQVLHQWPSSEGARKGLQDVLVRSIRWQLKRDNVGAVLPLLEALPTPRPDLRERYEERAAVLAAEQDARARLVALEREGEFSGGDWSRTIGMAANGVVWFGLLSAWAWGTRAGHIVNTPELNLGFGLAGAVIVACFIGLFRGLFLDNQMRRSFTAAYGVFCLGLLLNRVAGLQLDAPFLNVVLADHAVLTCFFGMLAARGLRTLWWATGLAVGGAIAIGYMPHEPLQVSAVTVLAVNCVLAWALRPGASATLRP